MMIRAIVVVKLPSQSRINLIWPRHQRPVLCTVVACGAAANGGVSRSRAGERRQAPPRQYTGFGNPAMAILAHPLPGSVPYFKTLGHKPGPAFRNGLSPHLEGVARGA